MKISLMQKTGYSHDLASLIPCCVIQEMLPEIPSQPLINLSLELSMDTMFLTLTYLSLDT